MSAELTTQVTRALQKLSRTKPLIDDEDCGRLRPSRRCPGLLTTEGEREGFRHVYLDNVTLAVSYNTY